MRGSARTGVDTNVRHYQDAGVVDARLEYLSSRWAHPKEIGALAEGRFFVERLRPLGFQERAIGGCWLVAPDVGEYWKHRKAFFLGRMEGGCVPVRITEAGLYLRGLGISSYLAVPKPRDGLPPEWDYYDVLRPSGGPVQLANIMSGYAARQRAYKPQKTGADTTLLGTLPTDVLDEIYLKQCLFDTLSTDHRFAAVDLDAFFFGRERIIPIEIKEKTSAERGTPGAYFGLDVGPFVKLCLFLQSGEPLFVVREIFDEKDRTNHQWKYVRFREALAASNWVHIEGGQSMTGGRSVTIRIPYACFSDLTERAMAEL